MTTLVRLTCASCGYGVSVRSAPESCPMCRGTLWVEDRRRTPTHDVLRPSQRGRETTKPIA